MRTIVEKGVEDLRLATAEMVKAAREMLEFVVRALEGQAGADPSRVKEMDVRLNQYELKLDHMCEVLLALKEPYATDFRTIFSTIKVTRDLERIGDESKFVARWIPELKMPAPSGLIALAERTRDAFASATEALRETEVSKAERVIEKGERLLAMEDDLLAGADDVALAAIAHGLGRIAARATNIAEQTIYLVKAKDVRHEHDGA